MAMIEEIFEYVYSKRMIDKFGISWLADKDHEGNPFDEKEKGKRERIHQYRKENRFRKGVLVGKLDHTTGKFVISFSLCKTGGDSYDIYDNERALDIARERIEKIITKAETLCDSDFEDFCTEQVDKIPDSIITDYEMFYDRCSRYFRNIEPLIVLHY